MICMETKIWLIITLVSSVATEPQFGYPGLIAMLPMPSQIPPPPPPVGIPIPMPVPVGVPIPVKETTTTCATKKIEEDAWPFSNKNFTFIFPRYVPLPPPALPFPLPIQMPPPVVMVPLPPVFLRKKRYGMKASSELSSDDTDSNTSSDESESRKRSKIRKKKYEIYRRHRRSITGRVRPMLTYFSENGDVKFRRYLTKSDEKLLMNDNDSVQKLQFVAGQDVYGKSRIFVVAGTIRPIDVKKRKQIHMKTTHRTVSAGNNQLVFRPPSDKKITNLSISFNIEK